MKRLFLLFTVLLCFSLAVGLVTGWAISKAQSPGQRYCTFTAIPGDMMYAQGHTYSVPMVNPIYVDGKATFDRVHVCQEQK